MVGKKGNGVLILLLGSDCVGWYEKTVEAVRGYSYKFGGWELRSRTGKMLLEERKNKEIMLRGGISQALL